MEKENDYSQFQDQAEGGDMALLQGLAERQVEAEKEVERIEEELKAAKKVLADVAEKELPELMEKLRLTEFKTDTGLPIKIEDHLRVGIKADKAPLVFAWVRKLGSGKMIKRTISVPFGMGEEEKAEQFATTCDDRELEYNDKTDIHNGTLKAFIKRRLEAGEEVHEGISVFTQKKAKVG